MAADANLLDLNYSLDPVIDVAGAQNGPDDVNRFRLVVAACGRAHMALENSVKSIYPVAVGKHFPHIHDIEALLRAMPKSYSDPIMDWIAPLNFEDLEDWRIVSSYTADRKSIKKYPRITPVFAADTCDSALNVALGVSGWVTNSSYWDGLVGAAENLGAQATLLRNSGKVDDLRSSPGFLPSTYTTVTRRWDVR